MRIGNKSWTNWNKAPLRLWQTQLNFAVWCASGSCGVIVHSLSSGKVEMFLCAACHAFTPHVNAWKR